MLSQKTQSLIQQYQTWYQSLQRKEEVPVLHVDEVASKVAAFYEKIRGIIEWREEHLLRKTAIERILKRRLLLMEEREDIAQPLLLEFIRGGHFPNDSIEEIKIEEVQRIIDKYIFILKHKTGNGEKERIEMYNWLLGIAACEIEENLAPPLREHALIDFMSDLIRERIETKGGRQITQEEKDTQVYVACQRALFKMDSPLISLHLLESRFPYWGNLPKDELQEIALNIHTIKREIEAIFHHPLAEKFYSVCEGYDTPYLILNDILSQNPSQAKEVLSRTENIENLIGEIYQKRLYRLKQRIRRAAFYSTISIFLTKVLFALLLEIPFDKYITNTFSYVTLGLNIFIPPALMMVMVATIRPPGKENFQRVLVEFMKIIKERERKETYPLKLPSPRGFFMNSILAIFYLLSFLISFGLLVFLLLKLRFGILSIFVFLLFLSLILFAATKIRQRAKELEVSEEKETLFSFFFDSFTFPFYSVGKWLSTQLEKYNIVVLLFNILIELPFQFFVEFLEQWRYFLREKKGEFH